MELAKEAVRYEVRFLSRASPRGSGRGKGKWSMAGVAMAWSRKGWGGGAHCRNAGREVYAPAGPPATALLAGGVQANGRLPFIQA